MQNNSSSQESPSATALWLQTPDVVHSSTVHGFPSSHSALLVHVIVTVAVSKVPRASGLYPLVTFDSQVSGGGVPFCSMLSTMHTSVGTVVPHTASNSKVVRSIPSGVAYTSSPKSGLHL